MVGNSWDDFLEHRPMAPGVAMVPEGGNSLYVLPWFR